MAECTPNVETHRLIFSLKSMGCTQEEARRKLMVKILDLAISERQALCEKLECGGLEPGICQTTIDVDDRANLEQQITYYPVKHPTCPQGLCWIAQLSIELPIEFKSRCICVTQAG